jgi:copper chaperone
VDQITFNVPDMTCGHCERAVREEVVAVSGVESVRVDLETKDVVVTGTGLVRADLVAAIDDAGYEAVSIHPGRVRAAPPR